MSGRLPEKGIVIRRFTPADYRRVMELWAECGLPAKPEGRDAPEEIERQTVLPNVAFFIAESRGRVVGTVVASHDERKGWINRLAVDAGIRRAGLGRRLVAEAETWFESCGLGIFTCLIEEGNEVSMAVFRKLGYVRHEDILYFSKRKHPGI